MIYYSEDNTHDSTKGIRRPITMSKGPRKTASVGNLGTCFEV